MAEAGPIGYIVHRLSDKLIHPDGGSPRPGNGTRAVLWNGGLGEKRLQFQFQSAPGKGRFGYIRHVSSGQYLHPSRPTGGDPQNGTEIVFWESTNIQTLYAFDEVNDRIVQWRGKYLHAKSGPNMPEDGTTVVTWDGCNDGARFFFSDETGKKISPYADPKLSGDWKLVFAVKDPKATHTREYSYKIGKSVNTTSTAKHSWNVSAGVSILWFSASAEYAGFVENSTSMTWEEEIEKTNTIEIQPGQTVAVWQYVFSASQYEDQIDFRSNIFGDTNSVTEKPLLKY